MRKIRNVASSVVCGFAVFGLLLVAADTVEARPPYLETFQKQYPNVMEASKQKCNVCHFGKSKKNGNNYGESVGVALGAKNIPKAEQQKVIDAMKKVEAEKSAVEGKTYGDLIKDGKLPAEGFEPKEGSGEAE
jgi:hypothetical protein